MADTALGHVVELNESAKTIRRYAFEVSLSALGAIVRSSRAGHELRGFNEVAAQMRRWSRDLESAVQDVTRLTTARVRLVSEHERAKRLLALLARAGGGREPGTAITESHLREAQVVARLRAKLKRADDDLSEAFEHLAQLGLMASVLSRAALIEAASGTLTQRRELTIASQEFASYADE